MRVDDDGETVRFAYPSAVEDHGGYVRSDVLLEFGGRNVIDPNERHEIVPDLAALTQGLDFPAATVTVLSPVAHLLGEGDAHPCRMPPPPARRPPRRLSRHWFDLACLAAHPVGRAALADRELLADVVRHKKVFFHAGNANYDHCLGGRLRLVPDDDQLPALRSDYDAMRRARIVGDDAPGFDALIERIRILEADAERRAPPPARTGTGTRG